MQPSFCLSAVQTLAGNGALRSLVQTSNTCCDSSYHDCAGKSGRITIKSDQNGLSEEEIDRLIQEAEEYAEQDKAVTPLDC